MESVENQSVKERLKQFIMFKNISTREFERQIGVSYGFIGNMSKSTSPDKIIKISHRYPDLNTDWLLTGNGEMLKSATVKEAIKSELEHHTIELLLAELAEQRKTIARLTAIIDRLTAGSETQTKKSAVG